MGAVHHSLRRRGTGDEGRAVTNRGRRALMLGGSVVLGAVLLLRILPWGIKRAVAAQADLRERATLLAHAREEIADMPELRDSTAVLTRALVGLAPRVLSGATAAEAGADPAGRTQLFALRGS